MGKQLSLERIRKLRCKAEWNLMAALNKRDLNNLKIVHQKKVDGANDRFDKICHYKGPAYIEPSYGYVITDNGVLIEESMVPNSGIPSAPWKHAIPNPDDFKRVSSKSPN